MCVPNSEVGYNSATARRGNHESSYEHVVALEKKNPLSDKQDYINLVNNFFFDATVYLGFSLQPLSSRTSVHKQRKKVAGLSLRRVLLLLSLFKLFVNYCPAG